MIKNQSSEPVFTQNRFFRTAYKPMPKAKVFPKMALYRINRIHRILYYAIT
jgi:hypothetical protein